MAKARPRGKAHEEAFEKRIAELGKDAFLYRFEDPADAFGLNERLVRLTSKPADYLLTYRTKTWLVECKDTSEVKGFKTSLIQINQKTAATKTTRAGGNYSFVVNSSHNARVYVIPAQFILVRQGCIAWDVLKSFIWDEGLPWPLG